ncbi:hypothetical protein [Alterinioella nitratireducens]|uniref:hypothetical protein n=1 Tax=Alterinioella nitratireducens TaxID=2735915 RepID=UPI001551C705|nr:hypothetical protein [Alterinioella nitratireducens]NPD20581.1 hypothetical protein [Alterinioella nitratireducens]
MTVGGSVWLAHTDVWRRVISALKIVGWQKSRWRSNIYLPSWNRCVRLAELPEEFMIKFAQLFVEKHGLIKSILGVLGAFVGLSSIYSFTYLSVIPRSIRSFVDFYSVTNLMFSLFLPIGVGLVFARLSVIYVNILFKSMYSNGLIRVLLPKLTVYYSIIVVKKLRKYQFPVQVLVSIGFVSLSVLGASFWKFITIYLLISIPIGFQIFGYFFRISKGTDWSSTFFLGKVPKGVSPERAISYFLSMIALQLSVAGIVLGFFVSAQAICRPPSVTSTFLESDAALFLPTAQGAFVIETNGGCENRRLLRPVRSYTIETVTFLPVSSIDSIEAMDINTGD